MENIYCKVRKVQIHKQRNQNNQGTLFFVTFAKQIPVEKISNWFYPKGDKRMLPT